MSSAFLPVVADEIWHQYPDYRALSVTVRGLQIPARAVFDGGPPAPPTWMESHIEAWRTAFRQFGANPRKTPCSVEALCLREIAFRQCLVDHGDAGSGTIIRRAEIAPGCDRHPQQLKIARVTDRSGTAIRSLAFSFAGCPSISTLPGQLLPVSGVPHGPIGDGIAGGSRIAR